VREILVIGIGPGDPEQVTVQAVNAMNRAQVFFVPSKGAEKEALVTSRRAILERYVTGGGYRLVELADPPRDRAGDYLGAVDDWHGRRAAQWGEAIAGELEPDGVGAFLVWGDPSLYDSTLRILERVLASDAVAFEHRVVPGITSVQALAARHRIPLHGIGEPVLITTGRRLAEDGAGGGALPSNTVVMLDGNARFTEVGPEGVDIYWAANLGTDREEVAAGPLSEVSGEIVRRRAALRAAVGWVMDVYLLRRHGPAAAADDGA
jgi:precorrin-6A synthase